MTISRLSLSVILAGCPAAQLPSCAGWCRREESKLCLKQLSFVTAGSRHVSHLARMAEECGSMAGTLLQSPASKMRCCCHGQHYCFIGLSTLASIQSVQAPHQCFPHQATQGSTIAATHTTRHPGEICKTSLALRGWPQNSPPSSCQQREMVALSG